ncbi:serine protease [Paenibacillus sp. S150]|uniref:S1 family peptidase n=1 Tax=Paenibacillus sp. S150 TaxID=2749826 RepID=UPI001C55BBFE|nr:serine protease [Paenibacillus sp. S150]MBW4082207.1 trypsin-like peptidase domain-containing protein [Paenibacillus sp. S150]
MKRNWLAVCLVFSVVSAVLFYAGTSSADTLAVNSAEQTYRLAENAMFYLRVLKSDGTASSTGTGIILSSGGTAATAYHVVKGAERMEGIMADGTVISPIKVAKYDELKDVAVLALPDPAAMKVKGNAYSYLNVRKDAVKHGEAVFALGYPLKNTNIITEGIVNSPDAEINGRSRILASAQVASGMSGGPLMDAHGRLAGIISGSLRTMNNIHLIISTEDLLSLLPAVLK